MRFSHRRFVLSQSARLLHVQSFMCSHSKLYKHELSNLLSKTSNFSGALCSISYVWTMGRAQHGTPPSGFRHTGMMEADYCAEALHLREPAVRHGGACPASNCATTSSM